MEDGSSSSEILKERNDNRSEQSKNTTLNKVDMSIKRNRVAYIFNDDYLKICDGLPKVQKRATMTHSLIAAYGLLPKMKLITPKPARIDQLELFHSRDYIDCLKKISEEDDDEKYEEDAEQYGLTYDCPAFPQVYEYASYVAGASVKAAQAILLDLADVAINWPGGWHHSKRDEAAGFCYFNDIVIAILTLRKKYQRVLYVDLDLHHGDGVQDAFCATSKVMTVSFHKVSPGFFPGTGDLDDVGVGKGKFYTVNVPLKDGIQDDAYVNIFNNIISLVWEKYRPEAVVCQCGADGLAGDPMASYNLTPPGMAQCIQTLLTWKIPLLLVGGGGYNLANTARCWAHLTGVALGEQLPPEIPEHKYFTSYGPDYQLSVDPGNRSDSNDDEYLKGIVETIKENLDELPVI